MDSSTLSPPPLPTFPMSPVSEGRSPVARAHQKTMPTFSFGSEAVRAKEHVAPWTGLYTAVGYVVALGGIVVATVSSMGGFLVLLAIGAITAYFSAKKIRARIRGMGIEVSPRQLPQLHALVAQFSQRLGLAQTPEVYVVEDSLQNGFAVKLGKKNLMLLTDDVIWGALESRDPRALAFVVAHELAHIALGHTGTLRTAIRGAMAPLSRLDELSADNVAKALIDDADVAVLGLALLTVGPQLLPYVDEAALKDQAREVMANTLTKKAEKGLTHPLLMRRIANMMA